MDETTVLFVDDEQFVLNSLERYLAGAPYRMRFAISGRMALAIMATEPVGVVVSDMRMPNMDGVELLKTVKERWPEVVRIALSAYSSTPQLLASINTGEVYRYLTKPLNSPEEIRGALAQAVELWELRQERRRFEAELARRNEELEAMLAQVKRLEGMLPICASCKNVRDDKGYWKQIEEYIGERSEAVFSHGICPDCMRKLYPEYSDEAEEEGGTP
jgi:DNA-binding NtrC family response regulator